jgi:putative AlgH/UPF0301 family transcriptional regulator
MMANKLPQMFCLGGQIRRDAVVVIHSANINT